MLTAAADETGAVAAAERQLVKTHYRAREVEFWGCDLPHVSFHGAIPQKKKKKANRQGKQSKSFCIHTRTVYARMCRLVEESKEGGGGREDLYPFCAVSTFSVVHTSHANALLITHTRTHTDYLTAGDLLLHVRRTEQFSPSSLRQSICT